MFNEFSPQPCFYCGGTLELWDYGVGNKKWKCAKCDAVRSTHAKKIISIEDRDRMAKASKISNDYSKRFGGLFCILDDETIEHMVLSLETGVDQFVDVKRAQREHSEGCERERERKYQELLAKPFTAKTERDYTRKIKRGKLREGDCELAWPMYFKFREEHPNEVEPLTEDDLAYLSQWYDCGVR